MRSVLMHTNPRWTTRRRRSRRSALRASAVLAIGVGVAIATTGCGYSQNWNSGMSGSTNEGSTLNWVYQ